MGEKDLQKLLDAVFKSLAKLSRHNYFNKELWRKLKNREDDDTADIQAAFVSKYIYETTGIPTAIVGLKWAEIVDSKYAQEYYAKYNDIWEDYAEWCDKQR